MGINVDEEVALLNNIAKSSDGEKYYFSTKEIKMFTKKAIKQELENSEDTYEIDLGVRKFIQYIQEGKIEIRVYPYDKIHAKVYIMRKDLEKSEDFGKVITGSSNFSYSGLKGNLKFNVELKNSSDVKYALEKFDKLWEVSEPLNDEYISTLKNDTWIKEDITPYELYLKFLFEYFADEINEDKIGVNTSDLPSGFVNYKYQTDAVNQAKRMLDRYNGVFLADVVGLGKTFITALLARELVGQKLDKESLVFTTINEENRYLRLKNIKPSNNLRDVYIREMTMQEQNEILYEETNNGDIEFALYEAIKK